MPVTQLITPPIGLEAVYDDGTIEPVVALALTARGQAVPMVLEEGRIIEADKAEGFVRLVWNLPDRQRQLAILKST